MPSAYPQIWAWRNWLLIRAPTPTLACARFFISCGACRSGHAGGVPLPANPSVGAALRAVRPTSRPHTTDASERRPYQHRLGRGGSALASLGLARYKSRAPLTRRLPPCRPRTTDASERRPYQHHARLAFTLHKQKPAAFLPRAG